MRKDEAARLLQWALPRLGFRYRGFRKVRGQVKKRLERRMAALGIEHREDYRRYLEGHPEEWAVVEAMFRISITKFYRDCDVWERLAEQILPQLAARAPARAISAWSAGCAAGEEAYTLAIVARLAADPPVPIEVLGTDIDAHQLARARTARYPFGSVRELPRPLRDRAMFEDRGALAIHATCRAGVRFAEHDLRRDPPPGGFDLVLCRYLAFTYFDRAWQERIASTLAAAIAEGGVLILGKHERLPPAATGFEPLDPHVPIYGRVPVA